MARRKKEPEEMKVSYDIDAFGNIMNSLIEKEICQMDAMKPLVQTLSEFGIRGVKAVSFIMRLGQVQFDYDQEKKQGVDL